MQVARGVAELDGVNEVCFAQSLFSSEMDGKSRERLQWASRCLLWTGREGGM